VTKIIVTPIDMSAPGSYRERKTVMRAWRAFVDAQNDADPIALLDAQDALETVTLAHAETEDGSPLEEALDDISAEAFDALCLAIIAGKETVPNASSTS